VCHEEKTRNPFSESVLFGLLSYARKEEKNTKQPTDPIYAAATISRNAGEIMRACLLLKYEDGTYDAVWNGLIRTCVACLEMMENFQNLSTKPSTDEEKNG